MSQYFTTKEGFQTAMKQCLTGSPDDAQAFADSIITDDFQHIMNNEVRLKPAYVRDLAEWRGKLEKYEPETVEFLRDGHLLAARLVGSVQLGGVTTEFESFLFAEIDQESGRMKKLIERAIWAGF